MQVFLPVMSGSKRDPLKISSEIKTDSEGSTNDGSGFLGSCLYFLSISSFLTWCFTESMNDANRRRRRLETLNQLIVFNVDCVLVAS